MIERLVIINDSSVPMGGATSLALLAAILARRDGLDVVFFAGDHGQNADLTEIGIDVIPLDVTSLLSKSPISAATSGLYEPRVQIIANWIKANDTPRTIYHLHNWSQRLSPSIFAALKSVRSRVIIHAHDFALSCPAVGFTNYRTNQACDLKPMSFACVGCNCDKRSYAQKLWRVGRLALARTLWDMRVSSARIILLTEEMEPFFLKGGFPQDRLRVVSNPVTPFSSLRIRAEENHEILYVGRLEPEKGIDLAVRAAQASGLTLRVIGSGSRLAGLAGCQNVILEGRKSRQEIGEIAQKARLLVAPAQWREPFGLVLMEAAASGLPVVVSEIALLAARIEASGVGWAFDGTSDKSLIALLSRLSADNAAIERASLNGYAMKDSIASSEEKWWSELKSVYTETLDRLCV